MPSLEAAKNGDTPKTQSLVLMVLRQVLIIACRLSVALFDTIFGHCLQGRLLRA